MRFKNFFFKFFFEKKNKLLLSSRKNNAGRNNTGKVTILSKGPKIKSNYIFQDFIKNWNKNLYYISSFLSWKKKIICLIKFINGSYSYTPLAYGSYVGQILNTTNLPNRFWLKISPGHTVILKFLKKFSIFFNLSLNNKTIYAKSAGTFCQLISSNFDTNLGRILLPSGLQIFINLYIFVTVGRSSNIFNKKIIYGKAGFLKFKGKKPKNRGVARNPVDHPHGGRTKSNSPEKSPWGWVAKNNK